MMKTAGLHVVSVTGCIGAPRGARRWALLLAVLLPACPLEAARIGDVTHLQGRRVNKLTGLGLVTGLKGTGDGGDFAPAIRPLAAFLREMSNPVFTMDELNDARNVAVVALEVQLPENGVREGDDLDVHVTSIGAAKTLVGGRLLPCPLQGPAKDLKLIFAFASGPIHILDEETPTAGVIRRGAVMEENVIHNYIAFGAELPYQTPWIRPGGEYITLVVNDEQASWAMAHAVAQMINEDAAAADQEVTVALAVDPKNVVVEIAEHERANPAPYIANIESLDLFPPRGEARVLIDRQAEVVVVTGDVEILPVIISYKDLTISTGRPATEPAAGETPPSPSGAQSSWITLDPQRRGKTRLAELVQALEQLRVPAKDQIEIVERLHRSGKLLGKLVVEE